jgi:hypothetical protein
MCKFNEAWRGQCGKPAVKDGMCEEHANFVCTVCGKPATHNCEETGQFVCGAMLCDDCEHLTFPDGTNGGIGFNAQDLPEGFKSRHVKKTDQKFTSWIMRDPEKPGSDRI